jgi:mannose-1-phosphate guanylyltransferase/mannose-6-phosphate isomerase
VAEDVVLAMHRDRVQDGKKVVDQLRRASWCEAVAHNQVYRPWGLRESDPGQTIQVKWIVVTPSHNLSR